jgi:tetratricopeptide (TPR) repeat protein
MCHSAAEWWYGLRRTFVVKFALSSVDCSPRYKQDLDDVTTHEGSAGETIGQRLRRLRTDRGLSQRELASPGVSYAYISRIEAGTRQPSVKALRKLARKLGVSPGYLETGSEIGDAEARELRLSNAELKLRLGNDAADAERTLREVLSEASQAGDVDAATRAQISLGLAAAQRGDHREAAGQLEQATGIDVLPAADRPDVYATLGRSYVALGAIQRAVELFQRCLDEVGEEAPDDRATQIRYATYLSYALSDLGDLKGAETVVRDALARADDLTDPYTRVRLYWSLARLSELEGRSTAALKYVRRAIALLEATEDSLHLARAHVLCAGIMISNGDATEAMKHLELAEASFGPSPEPDDRGQLRVEQARQAALAGEGEAAVRRAREALELLGDHLAGEQGTAWRALAEGLALQGDTQAADEAFGRAVELLTGHGRWREAAQTCRSWGRILRSMGREGEALDVLEQATDLAVRGETVDTHRRR